MIREKTPREHAARAFASAGLGSESANAAARLLFESGISFETAAVMGQRMGEPCTATRDTIQEAARRYRRLQEGSPKSSPWGRPIQEASAKSAKTPKAKSSAPKRSKPRRTGKTKLIDGILHEEVVEYESAADTCVTESERPTHNAWGRKLEG